MIAMMMPSHDCDDDDESDVDNDCDVVEPVLSRPSSLNQGEGQHIHQNYRNKLKQIKNKIKNISRSKLSRFDPGK